MSDGFDGIDPLDGGYVPPAFDYLTSASDWDVVLYDGNGNRLPLPRNQIVSVEFTYGENAGFETGTLELVRSWSPLGFTGLEKVEIWGFQQPVPIFRGYARTIENDMDGSTENVRLTLYGLQERLAHWQCRKNFCYGAFVSPDQVFTDVVNLYVARTDRLTPLTIDTTGVASLGLTMHELDCTGKNVSQALSDLCALFPNSLKWGFDVDPVPHFNIYYDRIYLRPRATSPRYSFVVGKNVSAITYPRDATNIVNRVFLTGGKLDYPNLLNNASFEKMVVPAEMTGNMLNNPGFEDADAVEPQYAVNWGHVNDPTRFDGSTHVDSYGSPHGGSAYVGLDGNTGSPDAIYQTVCLPGAVLPAMHATVWARQIQSGDTHGFYIILYVQDVTQTNVASFTSPLFTPPADQSYEKFEANWTVPSGTTGAVFCGVKFVVDGSASTDHGVFVDDAAFWIDEPLLDGWRVAPQNNAYFATLDWVNTTGTPYDGDNQVHIQAGFPPGYAPVGAYAEICTSADKRLQIEPAAYYTVSFWVRPLTTVIVAAGARLYKSDGTNDHTFVGSQSTISGGAGWTQYWMWIFTGSNESQMEPFFRFYNTGECFIDAAAVMEGPPRNPYQSSDTWQGIVETSMYTSGQIGTEAAASQNTWGDCEKAESDTNVIDSATAFAWGQQYFPANAVKETSGTLSVVDPDTYIGLLDGQIRLINVSSSEDPGALVPARVRYKFGAHTEVQIDLNNLRSDMGQLLRLVANRLV